MARGSVLDHHPLDDVYLVTGCADSSLRKWDVRTGRTVSRMTTDRVRGEQTLVWAVGVLRSATESSPAESNTLSDLLSLSDHTIVSGDSMGYVKFWDGIMGTQLQSLKGHRADCLCLAVGAVGALL
jgi:U3 small nucleolar RNA-associated protein 4